MYLRILAAGVMAVALAGCTLNGTSPTIKGIATNSNLTVSPPETNGVSAVTADVKSCVASVCSLPDNKSEITFKGGPLNGRTLTFDINDAPIGGTETGETAFLERLDDESAGGALFVSVDDGTRRVAYAYYDIETGGGFLPTTGTAVYTGRVVGAGYDPSGSGIADGNITLTADWAAKEINGSATNLVFRSGGTLPDILFSADIGGDAKKDFTTRSITFLGPPGTTGHIEGQLTPVSTTVPYGTVAGALSATDNASGRSFTGAFVATY